MPAQAGPRGYLLTVVVTAAAAAVAWWSLVQPWLTITTSTAFRAETVYVSGATLRPVAMASCWVVLACLLAVIASSGVARRILAGIIFLASVALLVAVAMPLPDVVRINNVEFAQTAQWSASSVRWLGAGSAVVIGIAACAIWICGPRWRSLSDRQVRTRHAQPSLWDSLDNGVDPTDADQER